MLALYLLGMTLGCQNIWLTPGGANSEKCRVWLKTVSCGQGKIMINPVEYVAEIIFGYKRGNCYGRPAAAIFPFRMNGETKKILLFLVPMVWILYVRKTSIQI